MRFIAIPKLVVLTAALAWLCPALAHAQDTQQGERIFKAQCAACHTVEPGKNKIGPSLAGVVGRESGSVQGFNYSPAMKSAHVTWTEDNLEKYLEKPSGFIPGNKMTYVGLKSDKQREAVIDYLKTIKQQAQVK